MKGREERVRQSPQCHHTVLSSDTASLHCEMKDRSPQSAYKPYRSGIKMHLISGCSTDHATPILRVLALAFASHGVIVLGVRGPPPVLETRVWHRFPLP